jgi:hypothetical protein
MMRHSDPRITAERYAHADGAYLQREVDKLVYGL